MIPFLGVLSFVTLAGDAIMVIFLSAFCLVVALTVLFTASSISAIVCVILFALYAANMIWKLVKRQRAERVSVGIDVS